MVEVNCETDFVAKNEDFREFAKNIAMHIAASNPLGIKREDIPEKITRINSRTGVETPVFRGFSLIITIKRSGGFISRSGIRPGRMLAF